MSSRVAFHDKLVSVMEVLANAAVAEICQLVDEGYALLRLEVSQRQKENEELRMKLHTMEVLVARGRTEREREEHRTAGRGKHLDQAPVEQRQVEDGQVDGAECALDSPLKAVMLDKGPEGKEHRADYLLIKEETLEEPLDSSNDDAKVNIGTQQCGEGIVDPMKRFPIGHTSVTVRLSEQQQQQQAGHGIRDVAAPEAVLKVELGREGMEETAGYTQSEDTLDGISVKFACSASEQSGREVVVGDAQLYTDVIASHMELGGEEADGVEPPVSNSGTEPETPMEFVMHSAWNRDMGSGNIQMQHRHHSQGGQRTDSPPKSGAGVSSPHTHTMTVSHASDVNRLITHYQHLVASESMKASATFEPRGKVFVCKYCGKCCTRSSNLKRHQRIHTGEKPFSCTLCGKKFTQSCSLKRHQSVHMGMQPFHCTTCRRQFSDPSGLQKHQCSQWRKTV